MRALLLARLGEQRIALRAETVARIASPAREPAAHWVQESVLGRPHRPGRGLVARQGGEERVLAVDAIDGIGTRPDAKVHRLPAFAQETLGTRGLEGLVEFDEDLVWLVDLEKFFEERESERPQEVGFDAK